MLLLLFSVYTFPSHTVTSLLSGLATIGPDKMYLIPIPTFSQSPESVKQPLGSPT